MEVFIERTRVEQPGRVSKCRVLLFYLQKGWFGTNNNTTMKRSRTRVGARKAEQMSGAIILPSKSLVRNQHQHFNETFSDESGAAWQ
jgi:hypothetical protein